MIALPNSPLTRENYFSYTHHEGRPIVHASALEHIYPGQGGSPKRLEMFFAGEMEKATKPYLTFGSLFHKYMENKNDFVVEPGTLPEPSVVKVVTHMFENEYTARGDAFAEKSPEMWPLIGKEMIASARAVAFQPRWGDDAIFKKVSAEGEAYWKFLCEAQGHHMLTAKQKDQLEGSTESVKNSPWAEFVFRKDAMHEVPILFMVTIDGVDIWCKALIDWLILPDDPIEEVLAMDYKTTSKPIGTFLGYQRIVYVDLAGRYIPKQMAFPGDFWTYRYYRQIAFYRLAIDKLFAQVHPEWTKRFPRNDFSVLAVESESPYESILMPDTPESVAEGGKEIDICFAGIAAYFKTLKKY